MAPRPSQYIFQTFDENQIKFDISEDKLGLQSWELSGNDRRRLAQSLETKMKQQGRLGELLAAVNELAPQNRPFNPSEYVYMLVMEHVGTPGDDRARSLADFCKNILQLDVAALKLTYNDLLGIEGDRLMYREKALLIQQTMQDQGRLKELLLAIRHACKQVNPNCKINLRAFSIGPEENWQSASNNDTDSSGNESAAVLPKHVTYENFDLLLSQAGENEFQVRVLWSTEGQAGPVTVKIPPEGDPKFNNLVAFLKNLISPETKTKELGAKLTELLFPGPIWHKFDKCFGNLGPEQGLRVRLQIEPAELDMLPWEYCWQAPPYDFIFQDRRSTLVRYPGAPIPEGDLGLTLPIRILLATAVPTGFQTLDVGREVANVEKALRPLRDLGYAEVKTLPNASRRTLMDTLDKARQQQKPFHVLHFVGHGVIEQGEGALALVKTEQDKTQSNLSASRLRTIVKDSDLKLVFLNACETAVHDKKQPMNSLARSLMVADVPAVVAMQFKVPDEMAILYSRRFYQNLAMGQPLDQSAAEIRRAAYVETEDGTLWGILAFFMRAPHGIMWQPNAEVAAALAAYEPPEGVDEVRRLVEQAEATYTAVKPTLNPAFTPIVDTSLTQLKAELAKDEPDKVLLGNFLTALSGTMGLLGAEAAPVQEKITAAQTAVADL